MLGPKLFNTYISYMTYTIDNFLDLIQQAYIPVLTQQKSKTYCIYTILIIWLYSLYCTVLYCTVLGCVVL